MQNNKVLYIAQESAPYVPDTHLSLMTRDIAQDIQTGKMEVRVFMPKYGCINERRNQLHEVIRLSGLNLSIDDNDHPLIIKVATLLPTRMQVYFIDNDDYFLPAGPDKVLETLSHPRDNDERAMFFTMGVIETVRKLRWTPGIIECSGWITSLVPLFIKDKYKDEPTFSESKIIFSLHSQGFDEPLDPRLIEKLKMAGVSPKKIASLKSNQATFADLSKLGMDYADAIVQADADVPQELIDYAISTGKPFLKIEGEVEPDGKAHLEFIKEIKK